MARSLRTGPLARGVSNRLRPAVREFVDDLVDGIWPPLCWVCAAPAEPGSHPTACADHALEGTHLAGARCRSCAARLADGLPDGALCAGCRLRSPAFRRTLAAADYGEPLRSWLLAFKHAGRPDLAHPLARWARASLGAAAPPPGALLVPVPLHPLRRLERGYDQAARLARALAVELGARSALLLRRVRATAPQGELGAPSRTANVTGAFRVDAIGRARGVVWLVDDVVTSGATAHACARELRRGGFERVEVLALARAGFDRAATK